MKINKDGWEYIETTEVISEIKDVISDGKEQDRVVDIMSNLLLKQTTVGYYFHEIHSGYLDCDAIEEEIDLDSNDYGTKKLYTVYDSSWLVGNPDSGYNSIDLFYGPWDDTGEFRNKYVVLSMNGCSGSSALSQYYKWRVGGM
tara:strand:- start:104 stop:532 length:429 start_codon:yes stop_codon:yes gene_type:complete